MKSKEAMVGKQKLGSAEEIACRLVEEMGGFNQSLPGLAQLVKRFSLVEFDLPELPDVDGYLFQYGKASWFPQPTFVLSIVRQLEVVDAAGDHEAYVQVQFEFRYNLDDSLDSVGGHSEWWFPGDRVSFEGWLDSVNRAEVVQYLAERTPREFVVRQEMI